MVGTLRCGRRNPGSNPGHGTYFLSFSSNQTCSCDISRYLLIETTEAAIVQWSGPCVVAAETQVRILVTALIFFHFSPIRLLPVIYLHIYELKPRKPRSSSGWDPALWPQKPRFESWSRHLFSFIFLQSDLFL